MGGRPTHGQVMRRQDIPLIVITGLFFMAIIFGIVSGGIAIYEQESAETGSCRDEFGRSCEESK